MVSGLLVILRLILCTWRARPALEGPGRVLVALVLLAGLQSYYVAIAAAPTAQPVVLDSFYDPPDPLADGRPGQIIRTAPLSARQGVRAWRILYTSTAWSGQGVAVSGAILAPDRPEPEGGFPLISFAHGTVGTARACAPSVDPLARGGPAAGGLITGFLGAGYAVVATDYEGLGGPGRHPYLVGESAARNVLDAVRAAQGFGAVPLRREILLYGASQGGHAVIFADQIAATYAPDLEIAGVVAAAPTAGLALPPGLNTRTEPWPPLGLAMMGLHGFSGAYSDLDLGAALTPEGLALVSILDEACAGGVFAAFADRTPANVLALDLTLSPPWPERLRENRVGAEPAYVPLLLVQGEADLTVPPQDTEQLVEHLCDLGSLAALRLYPSADHPGVNQAALADTLEWMANRLDGAQAPVSCT